MKLLLLIFCLTLVSADYWADRESFLKNEASKYFGHRINLSEKEIIVNKILMAAKQSELEEGFLHPENFPPAINFLLVKDKIKNSSVFKFIQKMPKGAALHIHDIALNSADYIIKNITYRQNLLMNQVGEDIQFIFADPPSGGNCWVPLKKLREEANSTEEFDAWLKSKLSLETDKPAEKYPDINTVWKAFQGLFGVLAPMLTYAPVFEDYFYRALEEFRDDNINYVEVRGTLPEVYDLKGRLLNPIKVLGLLKQVADKFLLNNPDFWGVKYIYAPPRNVDDKTVYDYLEMYQIMKDLYPDFLVGFDLVGQEDPGRPLIDFIKIFEEYPDVQFYFHAGETNWNGMTDNNLVDAILLNTTRIGHGYGLLKHPGVMEEVKNRGIAVEICPISHQVLGLIKDLRNHPTSYLLAQDFPLVISSDDPGLWGATPLSDDFYEAFLGLASAEADLRMLKQFALNSLIYSSLGPQEKRDLIVKFLEKWDKFIDDCV